MKSVRLIIRVSYDIVPQECSMSNCLGIGRDAVVVIVRKVNVACAQRPNDTLHQPNGVVRSSMLNDHLEHMRRFPRCDPDCTYQGLPNWTHLRPMQRMTG